MRKSSFSISFTPMAIRAPDMAFFHFGHNPIGAEPPLRNLTYIEILISLIKN